MWQNHIGNVTTRGKKRKSKNLVKMLWKIQPNGIIRKEHLAEFPDVSMKTNALLWRKKTLHEERKNGKKYLVVSISDFDSDSTFFSRKHSCHFDDSLPKVVMQC